MPISFHASPLVGWSVTFCRFCTGKKSGGEQNAAHIMGLVLNNPWLFCVGNSRVIKNQIALPAAATSKLLWHK